LGNTPFPALTCCSRDSLNHRLELVDDSNVLLISKAEVPHVERSVFSRGRSSRRRPGKGEWPHL